MVRGAQMAGQKGFSLKALARRAKRLLGAGDFNSGDYWERRYEAGGNSGAGSYSHLAEFKAKILNDFVKCEGVASVIEFGCGDGNQLMLARYPVYVGYDVSKSAVHRCRERFRGDGTKRFELVRDYDGSTADLALSLDVLFHLVEVEVYERYLQTLFGASTRFVCIYSSNSNENPPDQASHVRHRRFTDWIESHYPDWTMIKHVPNAFPYDGDYTKTSFAEFFFYKRP
jgi:cyclopropane fatty-acyl-phospholipid synthase-like methyltransferase